jgi:hypothetical protein
MATYEQLGTMVKISDGVIMASGFVGRMGLGPTEPSVFVYELDDANQWQETQRMVGSYAINMSGSLALFQYSDAQNRAGQVDLWHRNVDRQWSRVETFRPDEPLAQNASFGLGATIDGDQALVLMPSFSDPDGRGVYAFDLKAAACSSDGACTCRPDYGGDDCSIPLD